MLRIRTLGSVAIEADGRPITGTAAQRRRLALLSLLAAAAPRGISRDRVFAYLWPDSDIERARNVLSQALFAFRRELGLDAIIAPPTGDLRLNLDVISCDVADFEGALRRGDLEQAVAFYSGPFLDGFHLSDAPEFERWVDAERRRLGQRQADALEALAAAASARGDVTGAISWWRRLAGIDPTSSRVALGLMNALVSSGDHAGALQYARLHEILLREELDIAPDQTVIALVERLRSASDRDAAAKAPRGSPIQPPNSMSTSAGPVPTPATAETPTPPVTASIPGAGPARITEPATPRAHWSRWRRDRRSLAIASLGVVALLVVSDLAANALRDESADRGTGAAEPARSTVAVLPFDVEGTSSFAYLREGIIDILGRSLDGAGAIRTADSRPVLSGLRDSAYLRDPARANFVGRRLAAGRLVAGRVVEAAGRVRITATIYQRDSKKGEETSLRAGELVSAEGPTSELLAVMDQLTTRLIAALHDVPADRLSHAAALSTRSIPALRAYLDGEERFQRADFAGAVDAFQRATNEDTAFALAHYRLSIAADWASHPTLPNEALTRALRFADGLPEHERQLIHALAAWRQGRGDEALHYYRIVVAEHPDDVEAWYQLGEVLFHAGPAYGSSVLEARPAFERALQFRPGARESLVHLVRLAAKAGDLRAVDSLTRRALETDSTRDATEMRLFRAWATRDDSTLRRVVQSLAGSPDEAVLVAAWRIGVFAEDMRLAQDIAKLLVEPSRNIGYRLTGRWYVAAIELARGRWTSARNTIAPGILLPSPPATRAGTNGPGGSITGTPQSIDMVHAGHLGMMAVLPVFPLSRAELETIQQRVRDWPEAPPEIANWPNALQPKLRDFVLGLLSVKAGDTTSALRYAERLDRLNEPGIQDAARSGALTLRAEVARAGGKREVALALLETAPIDASLSSLFQSRAYERFLRAELLREMGREDEALRWYATQGQSFVPDLIYLAPSHLRQAQIYDRRGDRRAAVAHYRRFTELWSGCDPELRPLLIEAERRLDELARLPN